MKKLFISYLTMVVAVATVQAHMQSTDIKVKHEGSTVKQEDKGAKKERKRKALKKLEGSSVSEIAKTNFYADFGDVPGVTWERRDYLDVATFTKNGQRMEAYYDYDGQLIGTIVHKTFADLPPKAQQFIKDKYKDHTIGDVILYTDNQSNDSDILLYGTQFESADNYFVELSKDNKHIVLKVDMSGVVSFFKEIK